MGVTTNFKVDFFLISTILFLGSGRLFGQSNSVDLVFNWIEQNELKKPSQTYDTLCYLQNTTKSSSLKDRYRVLEKSAKFALERMRDFELSMNYMSSLKELVYSQSDFNYKINYHNTLGEIYYFEGINIENSFKEFKRALQIMQKNNSSYKADLIYSNYAISVLSERDYNKALSLNMLALSFAEKKDDYWLQSIITNNIGVNYLYLSKPDSSEYYFLKSFEIAKKNEDPLDDLQRALFLGLFYNDKNRPDQALNYFSFVEVNFQDLESFLDKRQLYRGISKSYSLQSDYRNAYHNQLKELKYIDSIEVYNLRQDDFIYQSKLQIASLRYINQLEKGKVERFRLQIISAILGMISLTIIIFFLVSRNKRNKVRNKYREERDALEKEKLNFEKELAERETASKALILLEKDNVIHSVSNRLKETLPKLEGNNEKIILEIISEIKGTLNNKQWEEFELRFNNVSPKFFNQLTIDFPNLSPNEKKLCAFLSLDMSSKQISSITGQSVPTINISRGRLRKKLKLSYSGVDFSDFFFRYRS